MSAFLIVLSKLFIGIGLDILARFSNIFSAIKVNNAKFDKSKFIIGIKKYIFEIITIFLFAIVASQLPNWLSWCNISVVDILKNNFGVDMTAEKISNSSIVIIYSISIIRYLLKTLDNITKTKANEFEDDVKDFPIDEPTDATDAIITEPTTTSVDTTDTNNTITNTIPLSDVTEPTDTNDNSNSNNNNVA